MIKRMGHTSEAKIFINIVIIKQHSQKFENIRVRRRKKRADKNLLTDGGELMITEGMQ